jgi:hypothetical protein
MSMAKLIDLAQENEIFVWFDAHREGILEALVDKLVEEKSDVWCAYF